MYIVPPSMHNIICLTDMLPPEILDKIFSFLATDQASLEACSNAHPAILQLVERYLYCNVAIGTENLNGGSFQTQELLTLLSGKPHISKYIRHLKISYSRVATLNTISKHRMDLSVPSGTNFLDYTARVHFKGLHELPSLAFNGGSIFSQHSFLSPLHLQ